LADDFHGVQKRGQVLNYKVLADDFHGAAGFKTDNSRPDPKIARPDPKIDDPKIHKKARTGGIVAIKAVAHKLARACFYVMRDRVPFDPGRCFG
jgi:hypothetical protein